MSIRFFHSSDWHLGQLFYHHSRQFEHQAFLDWLISQLAAEQPDALLIAGDIFDVINPAATAQKQLYQFLADANHAVPHLQIVMIAGNHDSGFRLEQVEPLLAKYNVKVVGVLPFAADQSLDLERMIIPLYNNQNQNQNQKEIGAWCVALPFLRPAELSSVAQQLSVDAFDPKAINSALHDYLIEQASQRCEQQQAIIVMGHAHLQGADQSPDSERPIVIGDSEALSIDLYDDRVGYVALGHLHKPQTVGATHIRYSGSPIPLSFSELNYPHQVLDVLLSATELEIKTLRIPRSVNLHKIKGDIDQVKQQLRQLPSGDALALSERAFVDIEYASEQPPAPDLRQQFEDCLAEDRYRLVRVTRHRKKTMTEKTDPLATEMKAPPTPEALFNQLWQQHDYAEDAQVLKDFQHLKQMAIQSQTSEPTDAKDHAKSGLNL